MRLSILLICARPSAHRCVNGHKEGVCMIRDLRQFPDDENGDVLWNMHSDGDNLTTPREVDFSVIFPNEEAALQFSVHMLKNEQKVSFKAYEGHDELR
jgi:23S rRNA U2552 (ribose-2'-O)-methylase RlmE/FtsJ